MNNQFDYKSDHYHRIRHPEFFPKDALFHAWSYYAWVEYIKPFSPNRVLEVGGGLGWNLIHASRLGIECKMVEPSDIGRKAAEDLGIPSYADVKDLQDSQFDLVLVRHVLEHVKNPYGMLLDIKRLLTKPSILELVLPVENPKQMPCSNDKDHHLYCWTPQTIHNLLGAAGFVVDSIRFNFMTGRRIFLPVWKWGGRETYVRLIRTLGRVLNARELVVVARRSQLDDV